MKVVSEAPISDIMGNKDASGKSDANQRERGAATTTLETNERKMTLSSSSPSSPANLVISGPLLADTIILIHLS
jgi:hypothetical protein